MADAPSRGRVWKLVAGAVLLAAIAFAVGRFSTFGELEASTAGAPQPNAADIGFARDMQVHHAQAVELALIEYRATTDDDLRTLSYDIATAQSTQRGEMYGWLVSWGVPQGGGESMAWMTTTDGHAHGGGALDTTMGMATPAEIAELTAATGTARDCQYAELMLRHHQGALSMTEAVIDLGSDARVRATAEQMSQSQSSEMGLLRAIQQRLGCTG